MCATRARKPAAGGRMRQRPGAAPRYPDEGVAMDETLRRLRTAELSLMELTRRAVRNMDNLTAVRRHRATR